MVDDLEGGKCEGHCWNCWNAYHRFWDGIRDFSVWCPEGLQGLVQDGDKLNWVAIPNSIPKIAMIFLYYVGCKSADPMDPNHCVFQEYWQATGTHDVQHSVIRMAAIAAFLELPKIGTFGIWQNHIGRIMTATAFLAGINYSTQRCQPGVCSSSFLVADFIIYPQHIRQDFRSARRCFSSKAGICVQGGAPVR